MTVGSDKLRLLRRIPSVRFDEEMRGYSKSQVDRVLETLAPLADEIESLQSQLDDANQRLAEAGERIDQLLQEAPAEAAAPVAPDEGFDETLRNTLLLAQRTADQTVREAERNAEALRQESTAKADLVMASARTEAKELKAEAHAQREQMLADAEAERAQLLADALEHAEARKQAIEEELRSQQGRKRDELLEEIAQLERSREDLVADVARFETFLSERRQGIRSALSEISSVLDDPTLLAETQAPDPADIGIIDGDDLTEVSVTSHSISTLETEVVAAERQAAEFGLSDLDDEDEVFDRADGESPWDDSDAKRELSPDADVDDPAEDVEETADGPSGVMEPDAGDADFDGSLFGDPLVDTYADASPEGSVPSDWQSEGHGPSADASDVDPFATAGFVSEEAAAGIPASPTADSVFASVPETADPAAYPQYGQPAEDPAGLGIDVESPEDDEAGRSGMSGLAEQARSRLASRVSRLRDTAVPEEEDDPAGGPPPPLVGGEALQPPGPDPVAETQPPPPVDAPASMWGSPAPVPTAEMQPDEWVPPEVEDAGRPIHPDARFEELPPDDPFLDELRQMTGGESNAEDDTLHKFLSEEPEKGESGGWFGRRR